MWQRRGGPAGAWVFLGVGDSEGVGGLRKDS